VSPTGPAQQGATRDAQALKRSRFQDEKDTAEIRHAHGSN